MKEHCSVANEGCLSPTGWGGPFGMVDNTEFLGLNPSFGVEWLCVTIVQA